MVKSCLVPHLVVTILFVVGNNSVAAENGETVDFNNDIRPILSSSCLICHGPDENERQASLRLDVRDSALAEADSGSRAIVAGDVEQSELLRRIVSDDDDERMPPAGSGEKLSDREIELLTQWIRQGAPYAEHWSYVKPQRPDLPSLDEAQPESTAWPRNEIDHFVLNRLQEKGWSPSAEADRYALARRVSLDLTGLPPSVEEVDAFVNDQDPQAFERLVERLLDKPAYGEHWTRLWLDLARYADSAGYADDPPRTIWAYRDWVIDALNRNMPFDQFTIEQIAGDLLPNPTTEQLVATGFHRNTLTNNEGGTDDEEFRNVAIVDRVNTTMAVWMGTTMACSQCHDHKYDPLSQREYFGLFAIFNNTQDKDLRDESPLVDLWSAEQEQQRNSWQQEIASLERSFAEPTEIAAEQANWEQHFFDEPAWHAISPKAVTTASGSSSYVANDRSVLVPKAGVTDVYEVELPDEFETTEEHSATDGLTALRIEVIPNKYLPGGGPGHANGGFIVTRVLATVVPESGDIPAARYVRVQNHGQNKILSLAEVQVFDAGQNIAVGGKPKQSSTGFGGNASRAIDGNTDGEYTTNSTTHTNSEDDPWWELDLQTAKPIERIAVWNRTDNGLHVRLKDFSVTLLNEDREEVWSKVFSDPPNPSAEYAVSGIQEVEFAAALTTGAGANTEPAHVLDEKFPNATGWGAANGAGEATLTLVPKNAIHVASDSVLKLTIEQLSPHENHTLGCLRVSTTRDPAMLRHANTPDSIVSLLRIAPSDRTEAQQISLREYYRNVSPKLVAMRERVAKLKQQLAQMKPYTTAPIMRELAQENRRTTNIQRRGNFLDKGDVVEVGVPQAFHPLPDGTTPDRLALARWLVDEDNPLTARVIANRSWEAIFGRGIVLTSEEFGSQGELPSHPMLLDWLATELQRLDWDMKAFLKTLVLSATYRQSSQVSGDSFQRDPENVYLARGPRFRLSAEMIRDQALAVSGFLSPKIGGPPVNPPQPTLGVRAAFGGDVDWETSSGEDRYRRGLYTTWRRSNPYPSMATFDAPNREVCTIRRATTNTPLQALVTLNDPVYVEAAQGLARRMMSSGSTVEESTVQGFRICLARPPSDAELEQLQQLYHQAYERYAANPEEAGKLNANPVNPPPDQLDPTELAAWTLVGNVLLNLDELLMKR